MNPDAATPPLAIALGILPQLFEDNATDQRYTVAHFRKKIRCNWKLAQEAFMESYHVLGNALGLHAVLRIGALPVRRT